MAMDYLPIQASAVPSERVFSSSSETDTKKRNRMSGTLMEILQLLKFSLKKQRLDFSKGALVTQSELLVDEPEDQLDEVVQPSVDEILKQIIVEEGLNIPDGIELIGTANEDSQAGSDSGEEEGSDMYASDSDN